jgi:hypothetical protein
MRDRIDGLARAGVIGDFCRSSARTATRAGEAPATGDAA